MPKRLLYSYNLGFTLVEALVVIGIMAVLLVVTFQSFQSVQTQEALNVNALSITSVLRQARSLTLASKNSNQFGVHFETSQVTLFQGSAFVNGTSTNIVTPLSGPVTISTTTLSGGGPDVVFQRLTGSTMQNGTVTVALIASTTALKTITIYATGLFQVN